MLLGRRDVEGPRERNISRSRSEVRRHDASRLGQGRRILLQDRVQRFDRRLRSKRREPAGHLEQNRAEAEDVGPVIRWLGAHLLRRHVPDRAHDDAGLGGRGGGRHHRPIVGHVAQFRQPEVENLGVPVGRDEDVLWLQVAMDDAMIVCGDEAAFSTVVRELERGPG